MNNIIVPKSFGQSILIPQSSTMQQFNFPNIQYLENKFILGLETYDPAIVTVNPDNVPTANAALLAVSYLTLFDEAFQKYWDVPLIDFITTNNGTTPFNPFAYEFDNAIISWSKSYVKVADITKISAAQIEAFYFVIKYADIKQP